MKDTLPKLPNELPNTDEPERLAAALIVNRRQQAQGNFNLRAVWYVDFFRGRPSDAAAPSAAHP